MHVALCDVMLHHLPTFMLINGATYIGAADLAAELGVTRQTIWRWRTEGKIPPGHRFRDKRVLFTPEEAEEIRRFAFKLEPAETLSADQLKVFVSSPGSKR